MEEGNKTVKLRVHLEKIITIIIIKVYFVNNIELFVISNRSVDYVFSWVYDNQKRVPPELNQKILSQTGAKILMLCVFHFAFL